MVNFIASKTDQQVQAVDEFRFIEHQQIGKLDLIYRTHLMVISACWRRDV